MFINAYCRDWSGPGYTLQYSIGIGELTSPPQPTHLLSESLDTYAKVEKSGKRVGHSWGEPRRTKDKWI